ncbi:MULTISPECIES: trimeric intracellular cation channel family protein [unclassified Acinetobacter]|uniref:trimeric intracellular cation channel family protein n=1 Tax=unclassified Acinetobacter TaxID=196816 RepID=UPI001C23BF93|nr:MULTISPECIES: trimeric intracellular cation channel family protein [unclassified Acinetobacter]
MVNILPIIDLLGTFVFALSGALIGVKQKFDVFGVFCLAFITAIGGGIIRDICISATPPAGLLSIKYLIAIILAVIFVAFLQKLVLSLERLSNLFDALGLGFFAAFGVNKTYQYTHNIQLSIILGCISAVGGGVLRDILANRKPVVFNQELYASAAFVGACVEILGSTGHMNGHISIILAIIVTTFIRLLAIIYNIKLPSIRSFSE